MERRDYLRELGEALTEVTKGWEELYEWARRIVQRREELYSRFERSEGEYERVVQGRERKVSQYPYSALPEPELTRRL